MMFFLQVVGLISDTPAIFDQFSDVIDIFRDKVIKSVKMGHPELICADTSLPGK